MDTENCANNTKWTQKLHVLEAFDNTCQLICDMIKFAEKIEDVVAMMNCDSAKKGKAGKSFI